MDGMALQLEVQRLTSLTNNLQKKLNAQNGADEMLKQIRQKLKDQVEQNQKHVQDKLSMQGEISSQKMEIDLLK